MKKLTKIISVLALLFGLFAALGSGMIEMAQADVPEDVSVTLHKKKMTALPAELIQNTGEAMPYFNQYDDMPNVEFTVYDVTDQFYTLRAGGDSVETAMGKVAANPSGIEMDDGRTDATGLVSFTLPSKDEDGRDAVYVFVETDAPAGTTAAANLALVLPMFDDNDNAMENILLYPKNVVSADGSVTVTKKGTANNELLPNADFIVSRELMKDNVEYLGTFNSNTGLNNWVTNESDARVFRTNADGQITITHLEHGDYNLIEIAAPGNASIIDEGVRPFTIGDDGITTLAFYVYNDTIEVEKDRAEKDDYNVGDLIPYSITVNIPEGMGYQFPNGEYRHPTMTITDAPDIGLQFNNDLVLTAGTTELTIDPLWMDTSGNGFVLTIPASALAAYEGQDLTLDYNMYLDGNAAPDIGYNNKATVTTDELSDNDFTPDVYTGGFRFLKVDANSPTTVLDDAVFVVGKETDDGMMYLQMVDGAVTWTATKGDADEFTSENGGKITVAGLEYGSYFLDEISAPAGYVLPDGTVNFIISEGTFTDDELVLDITNVHKGRLPSTGGSGILGIVGIGAALVATTGGYYIKRKKDE